MTRQLVLWGPPTIPAQPGETATRREVDRWVERCANVGVTRMISAGMKPMTVAAAHRKGIEADPYVNYTAFPSYGSRPRNQGWSTAYLRVPPDSPEGRAILDSHRPIWGAASAGEETLEAYAKEHPEFWSLTRDGRMTLEPGERRCLSLAFPEVRAKQVMRFVEAIDETQGDGVQVEFVIGNEDENGAATYGYEDIVADAFRGEHGKSPFDIPNDDPDWVQFRADYVTRFLAEVRTAVKDEYPDARFTATLIAGDAGDYIKVLQDWPAWIEQGILDELFIWWRTDSNPKSVERQARHVADTVNGRVPFIAELSCYHPGSFQTAERLLEGARVARANGADALGLYRSHALEQLDLWDALEEMGKL